MSLNKFYLYILNNHHSSILSRSEYPFPEKAAILSAFSLSFFLDIDRQAIARYISSSY